MHSSLMLTDAFTTIINETCQVLNCDRSSVFLVDPRRNELWTKVAKNSKQIRVQIGQGIVGVVAEKGELLNILDAHLDERFNREVDKINNYRTKSVLCVPIRDQNETHIIGVLQAINKYQNNFFTKQDEGLILIMAQLATAVLRNSLYHDEREVFHNCLKILVESSVILSQLNCIESIVIKAQEILIEKLDANQANIWIYDHQIQQLINFYVGDNGTDIHKNIQNPFIGIVGYVFQNQRNENILNAYENCNFNAIIDINTSMPIITMIIQVQIKGGNNNVKQHINIGVLQCINFKGLELVALNQKKDIGIPNAFIDTIESFCTILGKFLIKYIHL